MGLGRIPWHETHRWAAYEELDDEETESLCDLIERLDLEEIAQAAKDAKPKEK
jgi:hypothetical protein